jgi:periodic tryptophan protein 2
VLATSKLVGVSKIIRLPRIRSMAKISAGSKWLSSIAYTADGEFIIAGGNSKYVCIYDIRHRLMIKRLTLTNNRTLDGTQAMLNSKNIKDGVDTTLVDDGSEPSDWEDRRDQTLPGAQQGKFSRRKDLFRVQCKEIALSSTGRSCAVATTEGFSIYFIGDFLSLEEGKFSTAVSKRDLLDMAKQSDFLGLLAASLQLKDKRLLALTFAKVKQR